MLLVSFYSGVLYYFSVHTASCLCSSLAHHLCSLSHVFTSSAAQGQRLTSKEGARSPGPTGGTGVSVRVDVTDSIGEGDSSGCGACAHTETDFKFNFTIEQ